MINRKTYFERFILFITFQLLFYAMNTSISYLFFPYFFFYF